MTDKKPPLTPEEIAEALEQGESILKQSEDPQVPVDITNRIAPMGMHEHISIPKTDIKFNLTGIEVEFTLSLLSRVHQTLVEDVRNTELMQDDRNRAYHMALNVERLYGSVFEQLKLNKPERPDLH